MKTSIFNHFYSQHLVLLIMVPDGVALNDVKKGGDFFYGVQFFVLGSFWRYSGGVFEWEAGRFPARGNDEPLPSCFCRAPFVHRYNSHDKGTGRAVEGSTRTLLRSTFIYFSRCFLKGMGGGGAQGTNRTRLPSQASTKLVLVRLCFGVYRAGHVYAGVIVFTSSDGFGTHTRSVPLFTITVILRMRPGNIAGRHEKVRVYWVST